MTDYEKADLLWNQYKYRHEHCWKLLFQVTAAVVIISIVPYTVTLSRYPTLALPVIAFGLIIFSIRRVKIELKLWKAVRAEHIKLQKSCFNIEVEKEKSENFRRDVLIYFRGLELLALANGIFIWIRQFSGQPLVITSPGLPVYFWINIMIRGTHSIPNRYTFVSSL